MTFVTLALESAIAGGSISVMREGEELAGWTADSSQPKGEHLLVNIKATLASAGLAIRDVDHVAVSAGPGSFTGVRIGLATALGLKNGLDITMSCVSALAAMALTRSGLDEYVTVAIPMGRDAVCTQQFSLSNGAMRTDGPPLSMPQDRLSANTTADSRRVFILHSAVYRGGSRAIDFGPNVAFAIGKASLLRPGQMEPPLFVSKSF